VAVWKPDFGEHEWVWDAICLIGSGSAWPEGNEDDLRELADLWRQTADLISEMLQDADQAMLEVLAAYGGGTGQELNGLWSELAVGSDSAFSTVFNASFDIADGVEAVALQVEYEKLIVLISVIIAIISIIIAMIVAFFTAGASTTAIPGIIRTAQHTVTLAFRQLLTAAGRQLLRDAIQAALRRLTVRAIGTIARNAVTRLTTRLSWRWVGIQAIKQTALQVGQQLGAELLAQGIQIHRGHRDGWDMRSIHIAAFSAALAGPLSVLPYRMAPNYGGWATNMGREMVANVVADQGGGFLATGLYSGLVDGQWNQWPVPSATDLLRSAVFGTALSVAESAGTSLAYRLGSPSTVPGPAVPYAGLLSPASVSLGGPDGMPRIDTPDIGPFSSTSPAPVADAAPPAASRVPTGAVLAGVAPEAGPTLGGPTGGTGAPPSAAAPPVGQTPTGQAPSGTTPVAVIAPTPATAGMPAAPPAGVTPGAPPTTVSAGAPTGPAASTGPTTGTTPATGPSAGPSLHGANPHHQATAAPAATSSSATTPHTGGPSTTTHAGGPSGAGPHAGGPSTTTHAGGPSGAGPHAGGPSTTTHAGGPSTAPHAGPSTTPHSGGPHPGQAVPTQAGPGRGNPANLGPLPTSATAPPMAPPAAGPVPAGPSPASPTGGLPSVETGLPATGVGSIWSALVGDQHPPIGSAPTTVDVSGPSGGTLPPDAGSAPGSIGGEGQVSRSEGATGKNTHAFNLPSFQLGPDRSPSTVRQVLTEAAKRLANGVVNLAQELGFGQRRRPGMVLRDGEVRTHTSMKSNRALGLDGKPKPQLLVDHVLNGIEELLTRQGKSKGAGHGHCAEVALLSDRIHELAADWKARYSTEPKLDVNAIKARLAKIMGVEFRPDSPRGAETSPPPLDPFTDHVIKKLHGSVVTTHRIGESFEDAQHGEFAPPCSSCDPLLKFFEVQHLDSWKGATPAPDAGALPTGSVEPTRPYDVPHGLDHVHPDDLARMEQAALRGPDGQPLRHPDPREGHWLKAINGNGPDGVGRANNCVDCTAAFAATWFGDPTVAAPRTESAGPEDGGTARLARLLGAPFKSYGDVTGLDAIADRLRQAGPGSMAAIVCGWKDGTAHTFAMVNHGREVLVVDPQSGEVGLPPEWRDRTDRVFAIVLDPEGRPFVPPTGGTGPATGTTGPSIETTGPSVGTSGPSTETTGSSTETTGSAAEPDSERSTPPDASGRDSGADTPETPPAPPSIPAPRSGLPDLPTKELERNFERETEAEVAQRLFGRETDGVEYLSPEQAEAYRVFVWEGRLYDANGQPVHTSDAASHWSGQGRAIFVMDSQGNIYLSKKHEVGKFHHSSFLAGRPVAGAGEMEVEHGVIRVITDRSGHYQPPAHLLQQVLRVLAEQGVDVSQIDVRSWWA